MLMEPWFNFEAEFNEETFRLWTENNWWLIVLHAVMYVILVHTGQAFMRDRPALDLRRPLIVWSGSMAIINLMGSLKIVPELLHTLQKHGWIHSLCDPGIIYHGPTRFWTSLCVVLKVAELGDTAFAILRKQSLPFLQWYHHTVMLLSVFYLYSDHPASCRWYSSFLYIGHAALYGYYTIKALNISIPEWYKKVITAVTIIQTVIGVYINYVLYCIVTVAPESCHVTMGNIRIVFSVYLVFFILFLQLYYKQSVSTKAEYSGGKADSSLLKHPINMCVNGVYNIKEKSK